MNKCYKYLLSAMMLICIVAMNAHNGATVSLSSTNDTINLGSMDFDTPENSVVDEVIWVVGGEAILKSDVEQMRIQAEMEGMRFKGDPDCAIPEQIAVQKLFLHQAAIDSIEVSESEIAEGVDRQINQWISLTGSREKLEEYRKMSVAQIRQQMHDEYKNSQMVSKMKQSLIKDIQVTPSDVRDYFRNLSEDSIPYVKEEVEVQIITRTPKPTQEELTKIKDELRNYTDRVMNGGSSFATLARLYSEDGSARQGGELGYMGRGMLDPAFANAAFNLTDPKKVSKIVESEFGFHIIQLIDKRGDKVNVRHILRKPSITQQAIDDEKAKIDSIVGLIKEGKVTFEEAATYTSDDKDTRNNNGLMVNTTETTRTSRFNMEDLPTEVARMVEGMEPGDISEPFTLINKKGKTQVAVIKLKSRIDAHRATITEDFQVMKEVVLNKRREQVIHDWVVNKIKRTHVRMKERYKNCDFEYEGWVK